MTLHSAQGFTEDVGLPKMIGTPVSCAVSAVIMIALTDAAQ